MARRAALAVRPSERYFAGPFDLATPERTLMGHQFLPSGPLMPRPRALVATNAGAAGHFVTLVIKACGWALAPLRHRFLWHVCKYAGKTLATRRFHCTLRIGVDSFFQFYLDDPYWSRLLPNSFSYEQELSIVLARIKELDFAFIDCGANFGYWSVLVSSKEAGARKVLAIEASPETFEALSSNWDLNQRRFAIVNAGVSSETGAEVVVSKGRGHAGAHIGAPTRGEQKVGTVSTTTIDDAVLASYGRMPSRMLLKLDVEGAEIPALQGAQRVLWQDCLICYEDHGKDKESAISNYILGTLGWLVFFVEPKDGSVSAMRSLDDVNRIKMRKITGSNFFACRPDSVFLQAFASAVNSLDHFDQEMSSTAFVGCDGAIAVDVCSCGLPGRGGSVAAS